MEIPMETHDQFTAFLLLIHAAEHIQSTTYSFTNLTPENKARQESAALLYKQARLIRPTLEVK